MADVSDDVELASILRVSELVNDTTTHVGTAFTQYFNLVHGGGDGAGQCRDRYQSVSFFFSPSHRAAEGRVTKVYGFSRLNA